jgi:hypothetical protein
VIGVLAQVAVVGRTDRLSRGGTPNINALSGAGKSAPAMTLIFVVSAFETAG